MNLLSLLLLATSPTLTPEPEPAAEPAPAPAVESAPDDSPRRTGNEWAIHIAPGANLILGQFSAYGPAFRVGGWASRWIGNFMVGGGPVLHYSYLIEPAPANDNLHFFTLQGDLLLGGGRYEKFAIYSHMTLGGGVLRGKDGASGLTITAPGVRIAAGVGGYGYITPRFSLGALADFGYLGGLGLDLLITANVHFGRGTKR